MKDVTESIKSQKKAEDKKKNKNKPKKKGTKKDFKFKILAYILLLIIIAAAYYIILPPLHYASFEFWIFLIGITIGIVAVEFLADSQKLMSKASNQKIEEIQLEWPKVGKKYKWFLYPWLLILTIGVVVYFVFSPIFFPIQYSSMITPQPATFQEDFPEVDVNKIPLIDRDTATRLGSRTLGSLSELVSQFEAAPDYTQINVKDHPYRVTPLEYAGVFKWLNNFQTGLPNYIQVDMVSGEVELKEPSQPIKYSRDDKFNRNVDRRLRFDYPFTLFETPSFEVDDEGNPFYVATTYKRNFILREPEADGVILLNAMTGETSSYSLEETPSWVDRVHSADLIMHQLEMNGLYQNGFWNSLFAKNGVTKPTEGYSYLPMNDDIYMYTGITSVVTDDSNIGFVLVNMRTKDAKFYELTAAEEFSAMASAEGSVQEKGYTATFPLLINLNGRPMYILSLKDEAGLIKEYALIDVQNYQNVMIAPSVSQLMTNYAQANDIEIQDVETDVEMIEGEIDQIQSVVVDGNSVYYFTVDGQVYRANIKISENLPFIENGEAVEFETTKDGEVQQIQLVE